MDPWERPIAPGVATLDPWERPPLAETSPVPAGVKTAEGVLESVQAGYQGSATGLIVRGKLPDVILDPHHAKWYEKLAASVGQTISEIPEMTAGGLAGGAAGAPGGPITSLLAAGAGTFGVPTLIRESLMQAYESGQAQSSGDFLSRTGIVVKQTLKDSIVGALTFGAGKAAQTAAKTLGPVAAESANLAAQTGTMTVAPAALDGRLPEPVDFMNAAIMVAGGKAATLAAGKIREVYARTGIPPAQVVADAAKDTKLAEQLKADTPGIPDAYKDAVAAQTAHDAVPGDKAAQVKDSPFAALPDQSAGVKPTDVNYRYINSSEDATAAMARLSQVYEADIQTQRRGTVEWSKTMADASALLRSTAEGKDLTLLLKRQPGTPAGDAELLARKQMMVGSAEEMARNAWAYDAKVKALTVTPEDTVSFLASIERTAVIQQEFLGARAETGRALNVLKITKDAASRARAVQDVIAQWGHDPAELAQMMKEINTPEGALKFAKGINKATTWEKVIEAWKAGLISGPITHMANVTGTGTFSSIRVPIDTLAAGISAVRGRAPGEGVAAAEPVARLFGLLEGIKDGLKVAAGVMKTGEYRLNEKGEQTRKAIEGKVGEVVRLPFRALAAEDAAFRTANERGEAYALAVREAVKEGHNPLTREFRERVVDLAQHPTEAMQVEITKAGDRFTFNLALGEKGQQIQHLVRAWHLEWAVPFIRTPGNILKELTRMTPAAPLVAEWRADILKGGAAADKALAEILFGSSIAGAVTGLAFSGSISGAGDPDPSKARVKRAAGWQPYSAKIGDTWYSYARLQPVGTLMGLAADVAEVWEHMTPQEQDRIPKMIAVAFANAVTHQTFLQGLTNIVNATSDPERFGPRFIEGLAGSVIPGIVAQTAQLTDPLVREVDGALEAIKNRIPGARETLTPKRDPFGEPLENKDRIAGVTPITKSPESTDPVRLEAARLGVAVAKTPDSVSLSAAGDRKLGKVPLTPEERDVFADVSGHLAYQVLSPIVNGPTWKALPDMIQKRIYDLAFEKARKAGAAEALPLDRRHEEIQRITDEIARRLVK